MIPNRSLIYLDDFFRFLCKIPLHGSVLLSKFEPTFGNEVLISKGHCRATQKSERYFTLSKEIVKSKSIKERFKISQDYFKVEADHYSRITPITQEVESIHKYLIRSKEFAAKSYSNFLSGMSLGYISNVKETKDGQMSWSYNIRSKEYSDNYKQYTETSDNESKAYFRMLEQLVVKYNLLDDYKKAYPYEGLVKEMYLEKSKVKE